MKMSSEGVSDVQSYEPNQYICGGVASVVNVMVTFPINKVMFRQQVHGIRLYKAIGQLRLEGRVNMFRGLLPPLLQRTATVSLMFGTYSNFHRIIEETLPSLPYLPSHILAAVGAGTTEAILTPFERIQVALQVTKHHDWLQNTFHATRVIGSYGVRELYRGFSIVLLRNGPSNCVFLGLRDPLQRSLPQWESEVGDTANAFLSGAGLGAVLSTAFFPLNVVKNRMMMDVGGRFPGIWETLQVTLKERDYRWRKMFRGVHMNYTRSFLSWGIINAVYELLKKHFPWHQYYEWTS
ncbi:mitochondrial nicotinamide adenine dinucleotide transporter SLC25A51-like [Halichondria panicea]|uniref:mitochondrial nicotinamide adenine dinucleotide transporter SLC25A51-like n=1 Tax=Halichondria panicea TaxID=6063 RepID=UPI00312B53FF